MGELLAHLKLTHDFDINTSFLQSTSKIIKRSVLFNLIMLTVNPKDYSMGIPWEAVKKENKPFFISPVTTWYRQSTALLAKDRRHTRLIINIGNTSALK
jgi:hypothetical protein